MKKILRPCVALLVSAGMVSAAHATTFRPAGPSTVSGTITLITPSAGPCTVAGTLDVADDSTDGHPGSTPYAHPNPPGVSHGHGARITTLTVSGGGLCSLANFRGLPYDVEYNGTILTFKNVDLGHIGLGGCAGDLAGVYNHATDVTFTNASLGGCTLSGTMAMTVDIDATP